MRHRQRRTVRNKRLAHIARTLGWELKAARHRLETAGEGAMTMGRMHREERGRLEGQGLSLAGKLARIPRIIRWAFRAL